MAHRPLDRLPSAGLTGRARAAGRVPHSIIELQMRLEQLKIAAAQASLYEFVRQAWAIMEPGRAFIPNWHITAICAHLEAVARGQIRSLLINVPPGHMKSLLTSVFWPAWVWTWDPTRRFLTASYAAHLSTRDAVKCRRILESAWYRAHWPEVRLTTDQNTKRRYENDRMGYRVATSVGGGATGERGDVLLVDDPHDIAEAASKTEREKLFTWLDQVWAGRASHPETTANVIIMQRVHEEDAAAHVLEQGGWDHLILPTEYDPATAAVTTLGRVDPRTEPGELLWPQLYGPEALANIKRKMGSYAYAAQHQQRPAPAHGGMFKRDWWRFYTELPADVSRWLQSWDMTFKDATGANYVAGQVWAKRGAEYYLVDQVRDRLNFAATVQAVRTLSGKYPKALEKLVEDAANGPAVITQLKREVPGLIPVKPTVAGGTTLASKAARAQAIVPLVEAGNVFLPDPRSTPWVHDFIEEFAAFPKGAHDDQVDAGAQALARLQCSALGIAII